MQRSKVFKVEYFLSDGLSDGGPHFKDQVLAQDSEDVKGKLKKKHPDLEIMIIKITVIGSQG